jgi:RNA polymerase sigma-70 factor (ECF subfamily)
VGSLHQLQPPARAPEPAEGRTEVNEAALVERARGGDVDAWARLYQDQFDRIFRYIAYLTGDTTAAEDFVQETFARAYVSLPSFEGRAPLTGWLRGIAINIVRRHWRSRSRGDRAMDRLELMSRDPAVGADIDPEGAHLRQRRAEVLLTVLESLPAPLREAYVLCDLQDLPTQQAAAELGVSPGNVRVRATRARARIRSELTRLGWISGEAASEGKERDHDDP